MRGYTVGANGTTVITLPAGSGGGIGQRIGYLPFGLATGADRRAPPRPVESDVRSPRVGGCQSHPGVVGDDGRDPHQPPGTVIARPHDPRPRPSTTGAWRPMADVSALLCGDFNVRDFGALGDNAADDAPAILSARRGAAGWRRHRGVPTGALSDARAATNGGAARHVHHAARGRAGGLGHLPHRMRRHRTRRWPRCGPSRRGPASQRVAARMVRGRHSCHRRQGPPEPGHCAVDGVARVRHRQHRRKREPFVGPGLRRAAQRRRRDSAGRWGKY